MVYLIGCLREANRILGLGSAWIQSHPRELNVLFTVLLLMCEFALPFFLSHVCGYMYMYV